MFWIQKLIQSKMTTDDVNTHIETMSTVAEKLNALITPKNPLTVDDLHSSALLISLPTDWLSCVSSMMNEERVSSTRIVAALKAELLHRKSRGDEGSPITVTKAVVPATKPSKVTSNNNGLHCTFCNRPNHDLTTCNNVAQVLKEHKAERHRQYLEKQAAESKQSKSKEKQPAKSSLAQAGSISVVEVGNFSDFSSDSEVAGVAGISLLSRIDGNHSDINVNSGCSISMTPFIN
jgi:hypothetical protein